jgi:hypothetical protein
MILFNSSQNSIVTSDIVQLRSFWEKSRGLIGHKNLSSVFLKTRWGIHTFGVVSAIDILVLDQDMTVVAKKLNMSPNRLYFWNPRYYNIIEIPFGTMEVQRVKIGDRLEIRA